MDAAILNSLIFDYLSKKDKVLAETLKTKLKAVSRKWNSSKLPKNLRNILKILWRAHFLSRTHFQNVVEVINVCLEISLKRIH